MRSELKWVLVLFVLMLVIWTVTLVMAAGPGGGGTMGLILLVGSLWATVDFLRALWRYVRALRVPEDEEEMSA